MVCGACDECADDDFDEECFCALSMDTAGALNISDE